MTSSPAAVQQLASSSRGTKMGIWLIGMGVLHFLAPKPFDSIVPKELPGSQRFYTLASGVAEVGVGALLVTPSTRRFGALSAIALFIAVLPGNVNMCRLWFTDPSKSLPMRLISIARLPMQIPMITQALKVYRES
ncbi:DoxX family protein [Mycobacterium sp. C3-094]|uniref:DoxX family protein n=1 Tax=Mycobacterium sp. PSTR-4-N TaxID=2917745 RepID=UPI001F14EE3D|nr:hypothetical protein [Mycobacterium sp. PSTR-4-N]MCG7592645.1 hypothetical protein [Mycobacterium sp. PSTR-4-N]